MTTYVQLSSIIDQFDCAYDGWYRMDDGSRRTLPLERILDLATDAIITVDESQRIVMFNQGAAQVFGYPVQEALGQPLDMLLPDRVADAHRHHMHDFAVAAESARPRAMGQQREIVGRRNDGSEFPAEASIVKLIDGDQTTFTVILRDISERKRSEDELQQAETRYRLLIDGIQDYAIYLLDPTGHVVSWNVGAERMKGYQATEIIGRHFACFFTPEDIALDKPERELCTAMITGRYEEEGWRVRRNGSRFWANVVITAVHDDCGVLCGFAKVTRDTTERRQADEALRWYANQLHVLYEISRAILAAQSPHAIAEATLHRLRRIIACQYTHIVSAPGADTAAIILISDADDTFSVDSSNWAVQVPFMTSAAHLQDHAVAVINLETQDEATTFQPFRALGFQMLAIAPLVAHNTLIGELVLARHDHAVFDTSELDIIRQVADQLTVALQHAQFFEEVQTSRERLQILSHRIIEVQEMERRTIAGELHDEIGQALTIVKMNLQALQKYTDSAEARIRMDESIAIVERTLDQVRNLSLDLRPSLLDDLGLVAALRWYVARQARVAGFALHFSADKPAGRLTPVLETTCFRIAQEAMTNIVRHAHAHEVWVQLRCGDDLRLTIRDDGNGFDVPAAESRASYGESFGLPGMYERARIVGGHLSIISSPSHGACVSACLPLQLLPVDWDDGDDKGSMPA